MTHTIFSQLFNFLGNLGQFVFNLKSFELYITNEMTSEAKYNLNITCRLCAQFFWKNTNQF